MKVYLIHLGKNSLKNFVPEFLSLLVILIAILLCFATVINHTIQYDDAYNATVAKNLSMGMGYSSSYGSLIKFNPEITSGPTLILPAALLMTVFGNLYWIPSFTVFLLTFILFTITLHAIVSYIKKYSKAQQSAFLFFLVISFFTFILAPDLLQIEFLGEIPAAMFFCAGSSILFLRSCTLKNVIFGAILLGMAVSTKFIMLAPVIPLFFCWSIFLFIKKEIPYERLLFFIGTGCFALLLPILIFELYKFISLGPISFVDLKFREIAFFKNAGSGINAFNPSQDFQTYIIGNFIKNLNELNSGLGSKIVNLWSLLTVIFIFNYLRRVIKKESLNNLDYLAISIFLSLIPFFLWWLFLSPTGWIRHISPALIALKFFFLIASLALLRKIGVFSVVLICWVTISLYFDNAWVKSFTFSNRNIETKFALTDTARYLQKTKQDEIKLLGCGWWANRRLEYTMNGILNFHDCLTSEINDRSLLVIDRAFWNWGNSSQINDVEKLCNRLIFVHKPFEVYQCKKAIVVGHDQSGNQPKMIASMALSQSDPVTLKFPPLDENGLGKITRIGIMFGTYIRRNPGQAELLLTAKDGAVYRHSFPLPDLVDNAYKYFKVPAGHYTSGELRFITGGGVSVWEIQTGDNSFLSCLKLNTVRNQTVVINGCP